MATPNVPAIPGGFAKKATVTFLIWQIADKAIELFLPSIQRGGTRIIDATTDRFANWIKGSDPSLRDVTRDAVARELSQSERYRAMLIDAACTLTLDEANARLQRFRGVLESIGLADRIPAQITPQQYEALRLEGNCATTPPAVAARWYAMPPSAFAAVGTATAAISLGALTYFVRRAR